MKSERVRVLERAIVEKLAPQLTTLGFSYDNSTRTFRRVSGRVTQIVNVQIGQRNLEGHFALNLATFHPEFCAPEVTTSERSKPRDYNCLFRERLSMLRETPMVSFFKRIIHKPRSWLAWRLTTASDTWWKFSDDPAQVAREMNDVSALLLGPGIAWLDSNSSVEILRAAHEERLALVAANRARLSR